MLLKILLGKFLWASDLLKGDRHLNDAVLWLSTLISNGRQSIILPDAMARLNVSPCRQWCLYGGKENLCIIHI